MARSARATRREQIHDMLQAVVEGTAFRQHVAVGRCKYPHRIGTDLQNYGALVGEQHGAFGKVYSLTAPGQFLLGILDDGRISDRALWRYYPIARWAFLTTVTGRKVQHDAELNILDVALRRVNAPVPQQRNAVSIIQQYGRPRTKAALALCLKAAGQPVHIPYANPATETPAITQSIMLTGEERELFERVWEDIQTGEDERVYVKDTVVAMTLYWIHMRGL